MRVGVVGAGSIGRRHIHNLLALHCTVAVCDPSPAARAVVMDWPLAEVSDTLRFEGLDALVIASPWDRHLEWVEEAIRRKLPFFVEKPLGSLEQLPRWREIAALDLPVNQVGYMLRFHEGARLVQSAFSHPMGGSFRLSANMGEWPGTYGPPLLECSHEIDLALWCGAASTVHVAYHDRQTGRVDISFGGAFTVSLWYAGGSYFREWVTFTHNKGYQQAVSDPNAFDAAYRNELAHFLDCVRLRLPTRCPLSAGLAVLEVCQQVEALTA